MIYPFRVPISFIPYRDVRPLSAESPAPGIDRGGRLRRRPEKIGAPLSGYCFFSLCEGTAFWAGTAGAWL